jgi:predicted helicase
VLIVKVDEVLEGFRDASKNEREKGDYFERLVTLFLKNDPMQMQTYSDVWSFADWAQEHNWNSNDTGIDLVAKLADGTGFAAIQCKFYAKNHVVQKPEIDSFISAASNDILTRLVIVDTTQRDFGKNATATLNNLSKDWNRIQLSHIEESPIDWLQFLRTGNLNLAPKKQLRDHQKDALDAVLQHTHWIA